MEAEGVDSHMVLGVEVMVMVEVANCSNRAG